METISLYNIALVLHIIGIALVSGATLANFIITKQFWKQYAIDKDKGVAIAQLNKKIQPFGGIGFLLLILSGIAMMILVQGAYGQQLWMRVKILIIIGLILNSSLMGRRNGKKLFSIIASDNTDADAQLLKIKGGLKTFHAIQLVFFIAIFILAVFKFN
jgi:hypothetical protein